MERQKKNANQSIFNLSKSLRSPIADSTRILRSPLNISTGNNSRISQKRKPTSPLFSRNAMSKTSLGAICYNRTIDSQTHTDATSDGIASRLVKYGGLTEERRSNTSALRSSFIRTSPFPVIKLKKTDMRSMPKRSISLSHVRIAPPERVIFQATARSNILRSGSLTALNNVSRNDNEPLNPSSASEVGVSPAKSSLDALKEISRKRINNEELDAERIKKQCKEVSEVDNPNNGMTSVTDIMYRNANVTKRPREIGTSPGGTQNGEVEKQKKRLCTKSNEVMSSYSSSISLTTPRRQLKELQIRKGLDLNKISPPETPATISQAQAMRPTVLQQMNMPAMVRREKAPEPPVVAVQKVPSVPKITLFNKKYDPVPEEDMKRDDTIEDEGSKINFVKPKQSNLSIQNSTEAIRNAEKSKLALLLQCLAGDSDDESEDMVDTKLKENKKEDISVKPTELKQPAKIDLNLKPVENTAPLAETNLPKSTPATTENVLPTPVKPTFSFGATASTSTTASNTNTISTVTAAPSFTFGTVSTSAETVATTSSTTSSVTKPLESTSVINLIPSSSTPSITPSVIVSTQSVISNSLSSFASTTTTSAPSFNFGAKSNNSQATQLPKTEQSTTVTAISNAPAFTVAPITDKTQATPKPILPIFGNTTLSVGITNTTAATTTIISATTTSPITRSSTIGSSIFGAFGNQPNNSKDSSVLAPVSAPSFNFGNSTSAQTTPSANIVSQSTPATTTTAGPVFAFGNTTSSMSVPTTQPPAFNTSSGFNFGSNTQTNNVFDQSPAPSVQVKPTPVFGQTTTTTQPQSTPIFGQNTTSTQPQQNPMFGQNTTSSQPQSTPIFGQSVSSINPNQSSTNIFAQTAANQPQPNAFNQTAASNQSQGNVFGQTGTSGLNQTQSSVFGQTNTQAPANKTQNNVFGQTNSGPAANPLQSNIFGQSVPSQNMNQSGGFNFKSPVSPPSSQNTVGGFSFNSNTGTSNSNEQKPSVFNRLGPNSGSNNPTAAVSPSKNLFTFSQNQNNNQNMTQNAPANANTSSNIFGGSMNSNNNNNNHNNNSSIFGNSSNTAAVSFSQNQEQNKNLFNFGSNQNTTNNNSPFGFSGGSQSSSQTSSAPQSSQGNKPFVFGQNTENNSNSAFAFGSNNNNNNNNVTSPGNGAFVFGQATPQQSNKPFSFTSAASSPPPPPPAYGSQPAQETPNFQFNSGTSGNLFGANNNNNNPTPSFGTPATPAGPVFNFTAGANNNPGFGTGSSTGSSSGAFNFTASAQAPSALAFNIGTGGTPQTQRRPIRQATRRLNK